MSEVVLDVNDLHGWYGEAHVLHGVDFCVRKGEVVTLLGRNGAGRTTILRAILGLLDRAEGSIRVNSQEVIGKPTYQIAHLGVGYCPEERGIFPGLSCEENLLIPRKLRAQNGSSMSMEDLYELFPNLHERRYSPGTRLSGGEQQMLAVARILRTGANLLLLDEISEGLAPVIVQALAKLIRLLKERGFTIVMVEQNFHFAASLADRFYVVEHGKMACEVLGSELQQQQTKLDELLGV